jgi:hypothetical protein
LEKKDGELTIHDKKEEITQKSIRQAAMSAETASGLLLEDFSFQTEANSVYKGLIKPSRVAKNWYNNQAKIPKDQLPLNIDYNEFRA